MVTYNLSNTAVEIDTGVARAFARIGATGNGYNLSNFGSANEVSGRLETSAVGIGNNNVSTGVNSVALGIGNLAGGDASFAAGRSNYATEDYSSAVGCENEAFGENCSAFGHGSTASGADCSAFGRNSSANGGIYCTAIGYASKARLDGSTAIGNDAVASGDYCSAFGRNTNAFGSYSSALGESVTVSGDYSAALGKGINITGVSVVEVGYWSNSTTRRGAVRILGGSTDSHVVFSVPTSNTSYTDGSSYGVGKEPKGTLFAGGLSFTVNLNDGQLWAFYNSGGFIKSGAVASLV